MIYGIGGMGREALWLLKTWGETPAGFVDDGADGRTCHGLPVAGLAGAVERWRGATIVVGIGSSELRERLTSKAIDAGFRPRTVWHPSVEIGPQVAIGDGTLIAAGSRLTCDVQIGRHVQVNTNCMIHHDVVLDDFATLAPSVTLCGAVRVGRGAYIGAGAIIRQGITIGAGAVVGCGAVVVKDVEPSVTVMGVPAMARHVTRA